MAAGRTPEEYGAHLIRRVEETRADVVVIGKGWHDGWAVPAKALVQIRNTGRRLALLSWDDPDQVPTSIRFGLPFAMHAIGTCCWDEARSIRAYQAVAPRARVFLSWPGWDQAAWEPTMAEPVAETCDLLIGGSPYHRPTNEYRGPSRREILWEAIRRGWTVEVWGGREWLLAAHGGDPKLEPWYRGPYGYAERGRLWRRARVNVGTHLRWGPRAYIHDRLFMVGGAGRAYLMDDQPGVQDAFPEVVYFRGGDMGDLFDKAEELRSDAGMRSVLGRSLRDRILSAHTLAHRVDALLRALEIDVPA